MLQLLLAMSEATATYSGWKAPAEDGEFLIWPERPALLSQTADNQRRLESHAVLIQNVPLPELRRAQRRWTGHADDRPLIATGHQIELYHPGVWAKDVFIDQLAAKVGGAAYHLAVDTDAPKHLDVRWPGDITPLTDDPYLGSTEWAGLLETPTPAHIQQILARLHRAERNWRFRSLLGTFLGNMRRLTLESSNLTVTLTNAIHQLDWDLGLRHHAMLVSPLWQSPPYLVLVHHVMARAEGFASWYNAALAEYRRQEGISDPGRPWPDLKLTADHCEVPFWLDCLQSRRRRRAAVVRDGEQWAIEAEDGSKFAFDPHAEGWAAGEALSGFLREHGLRLSPRAMMLTLFVRLLLADQFVHGIGGGRYDQVTDRVIARCFGIEPPRFSVTTATLFFPEAAGQQRIDLEQLRTEGRRLRHGWADREKRRLAAEIAAAPRHSPRRRELFEAMHSRLFEVAEGPAYIDWQRRFEEAGHLAARQKEIFDRELFYAIQPEERLRMLMARYHNYFQAG